MKLSTLGIVQQTSRKTKHRYNIFNNSRSTSNNISQAKEFNIPDVLLNSSRRNAQNSKQGLLFECKTSVSIVELGLQNSQFRQWFWNILEDLASYWFYRLGNLKFIEHSFFAKNILKSRHIVAKNVAKLFLVLSLQRSRKGWISC